MKADDESLTQSPPVCRPWIVCERGNRWTTAVQRFLPDLLPTPLPSLFFRGGSISRLAITDVSSMWAGPPCNLVLWEVDQADFVTSCDWVTRTAIAMPCALQIAATAGLTGHEIIALSELGVAATIRHPEHLPSLRPMIRGHFARGA